MRRILERLLPARLGTGFRWVLASSWTSNLGDGFALAAGPLLVAAQTRDPTLVALATLLQRLPWLLFAILAGVLADQRNRAAIVATADLLRSALLAVLAVLIITGRANIGLVLAAMLLLGTAEVFSNTASATLMPLLVRRDDLTLANARLQAGFVAVFQLVGPPVGAALFALS
ncbi:MAG TPA: MFS transporter, partial [Candidatus Dormibacteraeota bacterium]|nr:MFS transporter [Candidatus Dormibacteraeota bacterium]